MILLDTTVQDYAWGAVDGLASLLGTAPSGGPEAELWVGAHPVAPSRAATHGQRPLDELVAADPVGLLGRSVVERYGPRLPFLLKVLAIGRPLSLQAHPSADQAVAGFAREEAAGLRRDAPDRTYRDDQPKPEMLVALVDTVALCGFRDPQDSARSVRALADPAFEPLLAALAPAGAEGNRAALAWVLGLTDDQRTAVAAAAVAGTARLRATEAPLGEWVRRLADEFPGDPGCLAPLLLHLERLHAGDAVHLPAGYLHAYLDGAGVEIMQASDNVLRGGLTPKHIDVDELLQVLRFEPGRPEAVVPAPVVPGVVRYDAGEPTFELLRIRPADGGGSVRVDPCGPALLLATGGAAAVSVGAESVELDHGRAAFVPPGAGEVLVVGEATVWLAHVGEPGSSDSTGASRSPGGE